MTKYNVIDVGWGSHKQNWDILEGRTIGPALYVDPCFDGLYGSNANGTANRWPNFTRGEMASGGDRTLAVFVPAMDALQAMRTEAGRSFIINSAYRSPAHNRREGGSKRSRHMSGGAFDISLLTGMSAQYLVDLAKRHGFNGIGVYDSFVHVDFRARPARW